MVEQTPSPAPHHESFASAAISIVATISLSTASTCIVWWHQRRRHQRDVALLNTEWTQKRDQERTGRIRAEVKLRTALKELTMLQENAGSVNSRGASQRASDRNHNTSNAKMILDGIGTVVSPYTKRMGTPRQPQLVPASRGYIQMKIPAATVDGIADYSHVWILFEFHANTDVASQSKKTKIRPPRAGGIKIGQLATRSPHRPNPIGLSLVCVDRWDETTRRLHVTGLDLVHGTPVYDIKPCVPWDIPGYHGGSSSSTQRLTLEKLPSCLKVPTWVHEEKNSLLQVQFTDTAMAELEHCVETKRLSPLYTNDNNGVAAARLTLQQILAQDPRSSHKGVSHARGSASAVVQENDHVYRLVFCTVSVSFTVTLRGDSGTVAVQVCDIAPADFKQHQYVDGVPLLSKADHSAVQES